MNFLLTLPGNGQLLAWALEDQNCSGQRGWDTLGGLGKRLGWGRGWMIDAVCSGLGAGVLGERLS